MTRRSILPLASLATVLLLSGCATDQLQMEIAEVRQFAQENRTSIERAQMSADAAMAKAEGASNDAQTAQATAQAAQTTAQDVQVCCQDNKERMNRVFRRAMRK